MTDGALLDDGETNSGVTTQSYDEIEVDSIRPFKYYQNEPTMKQT